MRRPLKPRRKNVEWKQSEYDALRRVHRRFELEKAEKIRSNTLSKRYDCKWKTMLDYERQSFDKCRIPTDLKDAWGRVVANDKKTVAAAIAGLPQEPGNAPLPVAPLEAGLLNDPLPSGGVLGLGGPGHGSGNEPSTSRSDLRLTLAPATASAGQHNETCFK
ncbi:hypothetical protein C5167_036087 [Papaver somniferum]|nr:hypothetical protein C5167_036087 [Papaver somniferum]